MAGRRFCVGKTSRDKPAPDVPEFRRAGRKAADHIGEDKTDGKEHQRDQRHLAQTAFAPGGKLRCNGQAGQHRFPMGWGQNIVVEPPIRAEDLPQESKEPDGAGRRQDT